MPSGIDTGDFTIYEPSFIFAEDKFLSIGAG